MAKRARVVVDAPGRYSVAARGRRRKLKRLIARFGPGIWDGADGAPGRMGDDKRRPWM